MLATLLRRLVSGQKRRFQDGGFDLDLAYISPRVIAMGLPAQGKDVLYRNPMQEIARFLQTYHRGHAKVYNLCSEHTYSPQQLSVALQQFPYDDHQVPPLALVQDFCVDAAAWLAADPANVVVVHCKAGKGRTGIMICCLMLYLHNNAPELANLAPAAAAAAAITLPNGTRAVAWATTAAEAAAVQASAAAGAGPACDAGVPCGDVSCGQQLGAAQPWLDGSGSWHPWQFVPPVQLRHLQQPVQEILDMYAERRTHDGNGVTIKSQRRYTGYFWAVLCNGAGPVGLLLKPRTVQLRQVSISGLPPGTADSCVLLVEARPSGSLAPRASRVCMRAAPRAGGSGVAGLCMAPCTHPCVEDESCSISSGPGGDTLTFNMPAASLGLSPMQQQQQGSSTDPVMAPVSAAGTAAGGSCVVPFADDCWDAADQEGCCVVEGDVRLVVLKGSTKLFYTWFNTAFLPFSGCYSLTKAQLDKPAKALPPVVTLTVRFVDMQPTAAVDDAAGTAAAEVTNQQQSQQAWAYGLADPPLETTAKPCKKATIQQHGKAGRRPGGKTISMLAEATVAAGSRAQQSTQSHRPLIRCTSADAVAVSALHEAPATCAVHVVDADAPAMQQLQPQAVAGQLHHKQPSAAQQGPAASSSSAPASPQARRLRSSSSWRQHLPAINSISTSALWGSSSDVFGHKSPSGSKLDSPGSWCGTAGFSWDWDTLMGAEDAATLRSVTDSSQASRSRHSKVAPTGQHAAQQRHGAVLQGRLHSRRSSSVDAADMTQGLGSNGNGVVTLGLRDLQSSIELPVMVKRPSGVNSLVDALLDPEHSTTQHPSANTVDTGMVLAAEASSSAVSGRGTAGYKPPSQLRKGYSWHGSNSWFAAMAGGNTGSSTAADSSGVAGKQPSGSTYLEAYSAQQQQRAPAGSWSSRRQDMLPSSAPHATDAASLAAELDPLLLCAEQSGDVPGSVLSGDPLQGLLEALNWSTDMQRYQGHDQPRSRSWRGAFSTHRLSTSSEPCSPRRCHSAVPTVHSVPLLQHARSAPATPAAAASEPDSAAADGGDVHPGPAVLGKPAVGSAAPPTPVRAAGRASDSCGRRPRVLRQDVCRLLDLEGWAEDESEGLDAADASLDGSAPAGAKNVGARGAGSGHACLTAVGSVPQTWDCALSAHHSQPPEATGTAVKRAPASNEVPDAAAAADVSCAAAAAHGCRPKARASTRRTPAAGAPSVTGGGGSHWRARGGQSAGSSSVGCDEALQGLLSAEGRVQHSSAETPVSMQQWQQLEKAWQKSWWV